MDYIDAESGGADAKARTKHSLRASFLDNDDHGGHGGQQRHSASTTRAACRQFWTKAVQAMRKNLVPGLLLQCLAVTLVVAYFVSDAVRDAFNAVADFKAAGGYLFSGLATAFAGGVFPWLLTFYRRRRHERARLDAGLPPLSPRVPNIYAELVFLVLLWFEKGIEVDAFYKLQAYMFGDESTPECIIAKTVVDQFIYNPFFNTHYIMLLYIWKDANFDVRAALRTFTSREYWLSIFPTCSLSGWMVWVPAVSLIYTLPASLQIPLFEIVMCFWGLLLALLSQTSEVADADAYAAADDVVVERVKGGAAGFSPNGTSNASIDGHVFSPRAANGSAGVRHEDIEMR